MEEILNRNNGENNDSNQLPPPPPYTTVVYKIDENDLDSIPPPSYADVQNQSVIYINNYPGPPLTDGNVQVSSDRTSLNHGIILSKKIRIYLILNGILTIIFGCTAIGIQIGILVSKSIAFYYYGFWGGVLIIGIGLSTVILYNHHHGMNSARLFHSFFWQMMLIAIVLGIGIIIILTDRCNDNETGNDRDEQTCKNSFKVLNGFLIGSVGATFLQSVMNAIVFGILKRHASSTENSSSQ